MKFPQTGKIEHVFAEHVFGGGGMPLSSAKTPPIGLNFRNPQTFPYRQIFHQRWNIPPIFWVKNNYYRLKTH